MAIKAEQRGSGNKKKQQQQSCPGLISVDSVAVAPSA